MSLSSRFFLHFALVLSIGAFAPRDAAADNLTSEQLEKILKELESIEKVLKDQRLSTRTSAVERFRNASSSEKAAYEFYLECVKELRFDRRDARFSEFRDWRDKNEEKLKEKSHVAALRLQLQYLVLTLRAAEGVEREQIVPEVERFVAGIVANLDELAGAGLKTLREPVNRTVFAEVYELNQGLELSNWSFSPGDVGGTYERTIFPYYRAEKPEMLATVWDRRIDLEKRITEETKGEDPIAMKKFEEERLPSLYWQKAADIYESVSQQQGALAMIQLIKANADHPNVSNWLSSFRELLAGGSLAGNQTGAGES